MHSEVERLITRAKANADGNTALIQEQSQAIKAPDATLPLSMREIACIAEQVLLDIRQSAEDQRLMKPVAPDLVECVRVYIRKLKSEGIAAMTPADLATFATPVLRQLGIQPSPADMSAIGQALVRYVPIMAEDMEKLASLDFSPPNLAAIAPPLPRRQTTWRDLVEAWRRSKGGILERDGIGIRQPIGRSIDHGITPANDVTIRWRNNCRVNA